MTIEEAIEDRIVYCTDCGEYLGDIINGILYKFGRVISEPHICERKVITSKLNEGCVICQYAKEHNLPPYEHKHRGKLL